MNPDGKSHRIAVLRRWHASIVGTGEPVPSVADLDKVGAAGTVWPPHVDRAGLEPWEQTIRWLFEQVALGVSDPVGALPPHLRLPRTPRRAAHRRSGPAPGPPPDRVPGVAPTPRPHPVPGPVQRASGTPAESDDLLARAVRWRDEVVARGEVDAAALKQGMLQSLVARNLRTVEEITPRLPLSLAHLAPELAAVLDGGTPYSAVGPDPAATSGRPEPDSPTGPDPAEAAGTPTAGVPTPVEPPRETGPTIDAQLKGLRFSRFLHLEVAEADTELEVGESPTGGIELRWDEPADGATEGPAATGQPLVVIYRVVSDDAGEPQSPDEEDAEPIAVTCSRTATDDRPFTRAVRYFAVWRHTGPTEEEAARAQPVPHAVGVHVVPPRDVEVHYDHPRVVGGWTPLAGTDRVVVTRTVREAGRHAPHDESWVGYEHFDDGFKDTRPVPGVENVYWVRTGVKINGSTVLSQPVRCRVQVPARHEAVEDLELDQHDLVDEQGGRHLVFDLAWTRPPDGVVRIYRTEQPPAGGLVGHEIGVTALAGAGLDPAAQLRDRPRRSGGRDELRDVPWPPDHYRAYFTPVTVLGELARVGPTRSASRLGEITMARIVERTREQVITFAWPPGATHVWLHRRGAEGLPGEHSGEITRAEYDQLGGLRVRLDRGGETVHLVPVLFEEEARAKKGEPVALVYPGLAVLWYHVGMRGRRDGLVDVALQIFGEHGELDPPPFALVHDRSRLPLCWKDGERLHLAEHGAPTEWWIKPATLRSDSSPTWTTVVEPVGFVRLCVVGTADEVARYALHDPAVDTLRPAVAPRGAAPAEKSVRKGPWWGGRRSR